MYEAAGNFLFLFFNFRSDLWGGKSVFKQMLNVLNRLWKSKINDINFDRQVIQLSLVLFGSENFRNNGNVYVFIAFEVL